MTGDSDVERRSKFWYQYLNQNKQWMPATRVPVLVEDMDESWRHNAARWLERRAGYIELFYTFGELGVLGQRLPMVIGTISGKDIEISGEHAWQMGIDTSLLPGGDMAGDAYDQELDGRAEDPVEWLKTTPLYKALVGDI